MHIHLLYNETLSFAFVVWLAWLTEVIHNSFSMDLTEIVFVLCGE